MSLHVFSDFVHLNPTNIAYVLDVPCVVWLFHIMDSYLVMLQGFFGTQRFIANRAFQALSALRHMCMVYFWIELLLAATAPAFLLAMFVTIQGNW